MILHLSRRFYVQSIIVWYNVDFGAPLSTLIHKCFNVQCSAKSVLIIIQRNRGSDHSPPTAGLTLFC